MRSKLLEFAIGAFCLGLAGAFAWTCMAVSFEVIHAFAEAARTR